MRYLLNTIFFILCFLSILPADAVNIDKTCLFPQLKEEIIISTNTTNEHYAISPQTNECEITAANSNKNDFSNNDNNNSHEKLSLANLTPQVGKNSMKADSIHIIKSYLKNEICARAP